MVARAKRGRDATQASLLTESFGIQAQPILKWVGGKWELIPQLAPRFPKRSAYVEYRDPFVGGCAMYFYLRGCPSAPPSIIADANAELVNLYVTVRDAPTSLIDCIAKLEVRARADLRGTFDEVRAIDRQEGGWQRLSPAETAARTVFLNRTCFNGLYRVNQQGQFNVGLGDYEEPNVLDREAIMAASKVFRAEPRTDIRHQDFHVTIAAAGPGSFSFIDSPYVPTSDTSSFTAYTAEGFHDEDHRRLAADLRDLDRRGGLFMATNSAAPLVYELYEGFHIETTYRKGSVSCKADERGAVAETVITNYLPPGGPP